MVHIIGDALKRAMTKVFKEKTFHDRLSWKLSVDI
jgi:hypothetical protein